MRHGILIATVTDLGKLAGDNMKQHTYAETKPSNKPPLPCPLSAHNCTKPQRPVTVSLQRRNEKCISQRVRQKKEKELQEKEEIQKVNLSRKRLRDRTT